MMYTKIKKIIILLLVGFITISIVGCTDKQESLTSEHNNPTEENNVNNQNNLENEDSDLSNKPEKDGFTGSDEKVVTYFNTLKQNIDNTLESSDKSGSIKDKLKGAFITIVDFIFYEGEIGGIKFDDLTEGAKQNILETAATIDSSIMTKFPNYKENISSTASKAYIKASELIKKGANNIKEFSKEKLGEENYNAIIEVKDEVVDYAKSAVDIIGDVAGTLWDKGKENIKNWYENFKNN